MSRLTPKQELFAQEYLVDLNATQAAIRAGYSTRSARTAGGRNLQNDVIRDTIIDLMQARAQRVEVDGDAVLREVWQLARFNMADVCKWGPDGVEVVPSDQLTAEQQRCVKRVRARVTESTTETADGAVTSKRITQVQIEVHVKVRALELTGRHVDVRAWTRGALQPDSAHHLPFRGVALVPRIHLVKGTLM